MTHIKIIKEKLEQWVKAVARYAPAGEGVFSAVMMAQDDVNEVLKQALATPPVQEPVAALDRIKEALPEFRQQDDYLLAHGASLLSEHSHEIIHIDTALRIAEATQPATPVPLEDQRKLPENAARLIIEAWIKETYGDGYSYHLSDQDEGTSWAWWIDSHPFEDPDAAMGFDGGTSWIDFEGRISDCSSIPDEFNTRMQAPPPAAQQEPELIEATDEIIFHGLEAFNRKTYRIYGTGITRRRTIEERMTAAYYAMRVGVTTPPAQPAHLAQVVRAHIQDLRSCLPTLREHKLSDTAAEVEKAANELEAAAAQPAPVQEPVAWMYELIIDGEVCNVECTNVNWNPEYQPFGRAGIDFVESGKVTKTPLYTTPPAPAPVPLTNTEFGEQWFKQTGRIMGTDKQLLLQAKRVTEAAHGITKGQP